MVRWMGNGELYEMDYQKDDDALCGLVWLKVKFVQMFGVCARACKIYDNSVVPIYGAEQAERSWSS